MNTKQLLLSTLVIISAFSNLQATEWRWDKAPSRIEVFAGILIMGSGYAILTVANNWNKPANRGSNTIQVSDQYFSTVATINAKGEREHTKLPLFIVSPNGSHEMRCISGIRIPSIDQADCKALDDLWNELHKTNNSDEPRIPKEKSENDPQ